MRNDFSNEIKRNLKFQQLEEWLKTTCGTKNIMTTINIKEEFLMNWENAMLKVKGSDTYLYIGWCWPY